MTTAHATDRETWRRRAVEFDELLEELTTERRWCAQLGLLLPFERSGAVYAHAVHRLRYERGLDAAWSALVDHWCQHQVGRLPRDELAGWPVLDGPWTVGRQR